MLKDFYKDKKILITGHTGFKGSWLSQVLFSFGADVIGVSLEPNTTPALFSVLEQQKKLNHNIVDIRDYQKLKQVFLEQKPEIVFHLAAQPLVRESYDNPLYTFETNIIGTANVLQAVKETNSTKAVVVITTDKVYENKEQDTCFKESDRLAGHDPYSSSKVSAEIITDCYIKSFFNSKVNSETLIASSRAGNILGGGDWASERLITDIVRAVFEQNIPPTIRSPKAVRPWQFVLESLYGYLMLAQKLFDKQTQFSGAWNFGPDIENCIPVEQVIQKALNVLGKKDYKIRKLDDIKHEAGVLMLDNQKAKDVLTWQPILNIDEAIAMTMEWYKRFYNKEDIIEFTQKQIDYFFKKCQIT